MKTISVGWHSAEVELVSDKLMITGKVIGNKKLLERAISTFVKGFKVITHEGDDLPITLNHYWVEAVNYNDNIIYCARAINNSELLEE